jgi:hypothetical protein
MALATNSLKLGMNPKRQDIYWAAGCVIGWIIDVLKVQAS